jgi:hypothetical protein
MLFGGTFRASEVNGPQVVSVEPHGLLRGPLEQLAFTVDGQLCGSVAKAEVQNTVVCNGKVGTSVTVQLPGPKRTLSLAEFQVYGMRLNIPKLPASFVDSLPRTDHWHARSKERPPAPAGGAPRPCPALHTWSLPPTRPALHSPPLPHNSAIRIESCRVLTCAVAGCASTGPYECVPAFLRGTFQNYNNGVLMGGKRPFPGQRRSLVIRCVKRGCQCPY